VPLYTPLYRNAEISFSPFPFSRQPRSVLIVTAHPDDEVMFFAPTILALVGLGVQVHALCLSIGDADNQGKIRRQELSDSYALLGVPAGRVQSIDDA
jgi:N-acetylglucosaminylphosphatidylinositol deacetylase